MNNLRRSSIPTHVILTLASMIAALPIVGVLFIAFDRPNAVVSGITWPTHWSFANLEQVWRLGDFSSSMLWSAVTTGATIIIATLLSVPAGFAFASIRFPGRKVMFYLFTFGLLLPYASVLIPAYYELHTVSLTGTAWAVILPNAALSVAFGVFWMRAVFMGIPRELLEAARVDGATNRVILRRVAYPLARSAVLVLVLLTFMWTWNSFLVPLVMLAGSNIQIVTMSMAAFQGGHINDIPGIAAAALFVTLPVIILYVFTQRRFVQGMTEGGLKM